MPQDGQNWNTLQTGCRAIMYGDKSASHFEHFLTKEVPLEGLGERTALANLVWSGFLKQSYNSEVLGASSASVVPSNSTSVFLKSAKAWSALLYISGLVQPTCFTMKLVQLP